MKKKYLTTYLAGFGADVNLPDYLAPDSYIVTDQDSITRPNKEFVISRDMAGIILSKYGDETWDLSPYRSGGDFGPATLHFNKLPKSTRDDAKWLMFILLYMAESGRATGLSVSTIMNYMKSIRKLTNYANLAKIGLLSVFSGETHLYRAIQDFTARNTLTSLASIIGHLVLIGETRTGISAFGGVTIEQIREKKHSLGEDKQHPVIPPRIFSELVLLLQTYVGTVVDKLEVLIGFLARVLEDEKFGRSVSMQRKLGYKTDQFGPLFNEAAAVYGVEEFFSNFSVQNIPNLSVFLSRTQHACKLLIHIYTGMRDSEVANLKYNCLRYEKNSTGNIYRIIGETSKLVGQRKPVSWITSKDADKAIKLAKRIAKLIGDFAGIEIQELPLFISPGYLGLSRPAKHNSRYINVSRAAAKTQEIYSYLNLDNLIIEEKDVQHLEKIDPLRAWQADKAFQVGTIWRFTSHQFRRSLAFYVAQSSLVSLPSLKRQLKHITKEMTLYYSKGAGLDDLFDGEEHISRFIKRNKPQADAIAYLYDVILSQEPLYGCHGKFIEHHVKNEQSQIIITTRRDELVTRFKKGEIAYKTTPLGACTTIEPCNKKVMRAIAACIKCANSVIKPSKLERVIERQTILVDELKKIDVKSMECKMEIAELHVLTKFRDRVAVPENS